MKTLHFLMVLLFLQNSFNKNTQYSILCFFLEKVSCGKISDENCLCIEADIALHLKQNSKIINFTILFICGILILLSQESDQALQRA